MTTKKASRPTFNLDDDEDKPVKAGGVIFYRFKKNIMELLIISSRGGLEDIGGCTDKKDKDIYSTVSREVEEESNSIFTQKNIKKRIKKSDTYIYNKRSKYVIFIIPATTKEEKLKSSHFGKKEIHDDIKRTISWISLSSFLLPEVIQHKLNWRLKHKTLFTALKNINSENALSKNIFSDSSSQSK